jgi:NurA-like 5'-3' nuclease
MTDYITKQDLADAWDIYHNAYNIWYETNSKQAEQWAKERLADACKVQDKYDEQEKEREQARAEFHKMTIEEQVERLR